jgi:hypothetical protein
LLIETDRPFRFNRRFIMTNVVRSASFAIALGMQFLLSAFVFAG